MEIYFASITPSNLLEGTEIYAENILSSFYYERITEMLLRQFPFQRFFLDSGAYTAKSKGKPINIDAYVAFIKKHKDKLTLYANLDVIGDGEQTWKNQEHMEQSGLAPLPVVHYGSSRPWLEKYVEKGHKYIALGGIALKVSEEGVYDWLDNVFHKFPEISFHGFGVGNQNMIRRYPWKSIDSTTWLDGPKYGLVFFKEIAKNYREFAEWECEQVASYYDIPNSLKEKIAKDLKLCYKTQSIVNILYFKDLEKKLKPFVFMNPQIALF